MSFSNPWRPGTVAPNFLGFALVFAIIAPSAVAADLPAPGAVGRVVWLASGNAPKVDPPITLLDRELFRQAVLIAARDGLGCQTRDESLREWKEAPPASSLLEPFYDPIQMGLGRVAQKDAIWQRPYGALAWNGSYAPRVADLEALSRGDFVKELSRMRYGGPVPPARADAPGPPQAETLLSQLDELSQFDLLRQTHALIRTDGESPQRLGILVRAYSNLSQLTRYHWSLEHEVYSARALLYAQRMVATDPKSAFALVHRAYAWAMVGIPKSVSADLKAAASIKSTPITPWQPLLEPYCRYDSAALLDLASNDHSQAKLALFLAYLTLENTNTQGVSLGFAMAALKLNPNCLRLIDSMCDLTGPGLLNDLVSLAPITFTHQLATQLSTLAGMPQQVIDQVAVMPALRNAAMSFSDGSDPANEAIAEKLIERGQPSGDVGEPSWAALGRTIQEISFEHCRRYAHWIALEQGVDAADYVDRAHPLYADHPFLHVLDIYRAVSGRQRKDGLIAALSLDNYPLPTISTNESALISLEYWSGQGHAEWNPNAINLLKDIAANADRTTQDYSVLNHFSPSPAMQQTWMVTLRSISEDAPELILYDMHTDSSPEKMKTYEQEHGNIPLVAYGLSTKYAELKQWADAERCIKNYIRVSPDIYGYTTLATYYKSDGHEDLWLATLKDFLNTPDYGLEHANVELQIVKYYSAKGDYTSALPYARDTANTGAAWGLECLAEVDTALHSWDEAEKLLQEEIRHYDDSPWIWYAWCVRTGHGDRAAAVTATLKYFDTIKAPASVPEKLVEIGVLEMIEGHPDKALAAFRERMANEPAPVSALHIALLCDAANDPAGRDAVLDQIASGPHVTEPMGRLCLLMQRTIRAGPDAIPDPAAVRRILRSAGADALPGYCVVGQYLDNHGHKAEATDYFRQGISIDGETRADSILAADALRKRGIDPTNLFATTQPQK